MFWDHLSDQGTYILCSPETDADDSLVYKAGLPILSPPHAPDAIPSTDVKDEG